MKLAFLLFHIVVVPVSYTDAACSGVTVGTDPQFNNAVRTNEETSTDSGVLVSLDDYVVNCDCGVLTEWSFYAKRGGTTHFFVSRGGTIVGSSSFYVPQLTTVDTLSDQYFHVALSSQMWISVRNGDKLGFYTEGSPPMITYGANIGSSATRDTGLTSLPGSVTGSLITTRQYAVMAKIEDAKAPFFLNLPYTTTLYTHDTGTVVHTYSVTDLDPQDVASLSVTKTSGDPAFVLDPIANDELARQLPISEHAHVNKYELTKCSTTSETITYTSKLSVAGSPFTIDLTVTDPCGKTDVQTITVKLFDEPPFFDNLPAGGATLDESGNKVGLPFTISVTDPSGDAVTCNLDDISPVAGPLSLTGMVIDYTGGAVSYTTSKYYDLLISCTDIGFNTIYSNFVVDIIKNEPPTLTNLPASVLSLDTNNVPGTIFTASATDPESGSLTFSLTCTSSSGGACPFSINPSSGVVTAPSLTDPGYDIVITVTDDKSNTDEGKLTVTVTGFTSPPAFTNLPATRNVVEGTAAGSYLYKVNFKDENIFNTFTLAKSAVSSPDVDTYFDFDVATGVVSLKADFDFEALTDTSNLSMNITVTDDTGESDTGTMIFNFENRNEAPTITIANPAISADEGPKDTVFTDPGITGSDPDTSTGDTAKLTFSMNCGTSSKYFYLNDADMRIYFSREYDMDSGLSGIVSCDVTVTDPKGLQDTGTITLTINAVNDYDPKFPQRYYTFFLTPTDTFLTRISDSSAYDNDSTNDVLTYSMANGKSGTPGNFFQIDAAGILYVRDVSSFQLGSTYYFDVIATDATAPVRSGTTQIFIIFSSVASPDATTTTERSFTFVEDNNNFVWLTVVGLVVLALLIVIVFIIYLDPPVRKAIARKILRFQAAFKEKPKEPKRYPVGKLKIAVGTKVLENDPDSKLPWEFQPSASLDSKTEDKIGKPKEKMKPVKELKIISGAPPVTSVEAEVHSSSSGDKEGSQNNSEEEYNSEDEDPGADEWGDLATVAPANKIN